MLKRNIDRPRSEEYHPKGWGHEVWIANSPLYCGKKLVIKKGKRCSLHYHLKKDETFYVQVGKLQLEYYLPGDKDAVVTTLRKGDSFHVPRRMAHRLEALVNSELFEFSTQHFESDSHRIEAGD